MSSAPERSDRIAAGARLWGWIGPVALLALYAGLTAWTWRRWGDARIDHGQQLYQPWQILAGRDLYVDMAWVYGPFSQYLDALWFRLFGVSWTTLIAADLAILAGLCALLYGLLARYCDRLAATLAVAAFLVVFAFGHLTVLGNYNFVAPYAHEATHGTVLLFAGLALLAAHLRSGARAPALGAGVTTGFALLTKPEIAVASIGTAVWAVLFSAWLRGRGRALHAVRVRWIVAGVALAIAFAYAVLAWRTSPAGALLALSHAFQPLAGSDVAGAYYFQAGLGFDRPLANLGAMVAAALAVAGGTALLAALDGRLPAGTAARWRDAALAAAFGGALWLWVPAGPWTPFGRALPLLTLAVFAGFAREAARAADDAEARRFCVLSMWCVLALGLSSKMVLNGRLHHYGFFLAMPSTLIVIAALAWWIPRRLGPLRGTLVRDCTAACVAVAAIAHGSHSAVFYARKSFPFGHGGDTILSGATEQGGYGEMMQRVLDRIEARVQRDETLVALPYGIMLNYQARRANPTPYMRWTGLEFIIWGEATMLESLARTRPDWIALVYSASQQEFRLGRFGEDPRNGRALLAWIEANYETVDRIGAEPFKSRYFGAKLMRARPTGGAATRPKAGTEAP